MAKREKKFQPHRILREIYRHYSEFEDLFRSHGIHVIDHAIEIDGEKIPITISFFDLKEGLVPKKHGGILSDRKLQAVWLNVIKDYKQKDVAEAMDITTVSVGQYVEHAMEQLAEKYFPEFYEEAPEPQIDHKVEELREKYDLERPADKRKRTKDSD